MRLALRHFTAGYDDTIVIRDVDLDLASGEALAIVGRNGMGKTTLLRGALGFLRNTSGSVRLDEREVRTLPTHRIIRAGIAYAPQEHALVDELSVADNLACAVLGGAAAGRREEMLSYFPILGQRLRQRAGTLSGGEQKMLVAARALLAGPRLLVLDEISAGLQPAVLDAVVEALRCERRNRPMTVLMVEQNIDFVLRVADRIAVMRRGELAWQCGARSEHREALERELSL